MGFVGNLLGFPAVKGFWKSVKNWPKLLPWVWCAVFLGHLVYPVRMDLLIGMQLFFAAIELVVDVFMYLPSWRFVQVTVLSAEQNRWSGLYRSTVLLGTGVQVSLVLLTSHWSPALYLRCFCMLNIDDTLPLEATETMFVISCNSTKTLST